MSSEHSEIASHRYEGRGLRVEKKARVDVRIKESREEAEKRATAISAAVAGTADAETELEREYDDWDEFNKGERTGHSYASKGNAAEVAARVKLELSKRPVDSFDPPARRPATGDDRLMFAMLMDEADGKISRL